MNRDTSHEHGTGKVNRAKKIALTVAYDALKAVSGVNKPFEPSAEFLHKHSKDSDWNESYYFNFFDSQNRIGGWTRIGFLPNQELDHGLMVIYWKDKKTLAFFDRKRMSSREGELALGGLEYACLEPVKAWKIGFRGDLCETEKGDVIGLEKAEPIDGIGAEVELTFEAISPPFDIRKVDSRVLADMLVESGATIGDARKSKKVTHRHYEQAGKVTGRIKIDGEEIRFIGGGHRDHSWGVRDWSAPNYWNFSTCHFADELAYSFGRVSLGHMVLRFGFIVENGRNHAIRESSITVNGNNDPFQQKVHLSMAYSTDKGAAVSGNAICVTPVVFETPAGQILINEALTEYRWKDRVGLGIFETLSSDSGDR